MRICRALFLLILLLILSGCGQGPSDTTTQDEPAAGVEEEKTQPGTTIKEYDTKLVFIKETGQNWLVVDEHGVVYAIDSSTINFHPAPGYVCENGIVTVDDTGECRVKQLSPGGISYFRQVSASKAAAADVFAAALLNGFMFCGDSDYAISEYWLRGVEVEQEYDGRIDASVTFDVKPLKEAYVWGPTNEQGIIKNRQFAFTIYGAEGTWLCIDHYSKYFESGGTLPPPPRTKYTPTETQNVLFEDDVWSYYGDQSILPKTKELEELDAAAGWNTVEYLGTINRINRQSGAVEQLYVGDKNHSYKLFVHYLNRLYILSDTWAPYSEGWPSYFGVLDLETKKYEKLLEGPVVRGTVKEDKGYLFTGEKLVELDLGNGNLRTVCPLPEVPNYTYGGVFVNYLLDGEMSFTMMDDPFVFGHEYLVDLQTGSVEPVQL